MASIEERREESRRRLRKLRVATPLTQRQLAVELGVEPVTVRRWERGTEEMGPFFEHRLADRMGCTVAYLRAAAGFGWG